MVVTLDRFSYLLVLLVLVVFQVKVGLEALLGDKEPAFM